MLRRYRAAIIALTLLAGARSALAEGPGIRLGDRLVFHPSVGLEFRWDSNLFYEDVNPTNAFLLRVTPRFDLATRPSSRDQMAHKIDFRLHAGLDYREFLTSSAAITQHRQFGVQAGALLSLLRGQKFSLDIFDNYVRTTQLPYSNTPYNIDRNTNEVGLRIGMRPGGGRLEITTGYSFGIEFFETAAFQEFDTYIHRVNARVAWKFFPKTAAWIEANGQMIVYRNPGGPAMHPNAFPLRVIAGVTGLLTTKLTLNVWAGYANGFYASGPSPNTGIGGIDLGWKPFTRTGVSVGYKHEFANSLLGSFFDSDMAYLGLMQMLWRFTLSARASYSNLRYQGIPPSSAVVDANGMPVTTRTDNMVTAMFAVDYSFKDWLKLVLAYDLSYNNTSARLLAGTGLIPANYLKHEVALRLTLAY